MSSRTGAARAAACLLFGILLIGFASIASLPPFEGFDETAHYSSIQQIAETGVWPKAGDPISATVDDYLDAAPSARMLRSRWSYADFFAAPAEVVDSGERFIRTPRAPSSGWTAGKSANWQAQHPPLYYLVMAPFYEMSRNGSLASQLLLLRGVSFLLAWIGLCLAVVWCWRWAERGGSGGAALILAPALWPILFPMWFPEMARLGNDGLVLLLSVPTWWAFAGLSTVAAAAQVKRAAVLGLAIGLALLTKAIVLPFAAAVGAALGWRAWKARGDAPRRRARASELAVYVLGVAAIAGWWFAAKYLETGSVLGSNDAVQLNASGGLMAGLAANASIAAFVRGLSVMVASFIWAGTWSVVKVPPVAYAPFILTLVLLAFAYGRAFATRTTPPAPDCMPLLTLFGLLAGLAQHLAVMIAWLGSAAIGGWYLHAFAPLFAVLLARSLEGAATQPVLRAGLSLLAFYPLIFLPFAMLLQVRYFAGCIDSDASASLLAAWSGGSCGFDFVRIGERLSRLAAPTAALWLFAAGWVAVLAGMTAAVRCWVNDARRPTED